MTELANIQLQNWLPIDWSRFRKAGSSKWQGPCPWCGGKDRFYVSTDSNGVQWYKCNQSCTASMEGLKPGRQAGNVISYLMGHKQMTYPQACDAIGKPLDKMPSKPRAEVSRLSVGLAPSQQWQAAAEKLVAECADALWSEQGINALKYLRGRGFGDDTIRAARIGYSAKEAWGRKDDWGLDDKDAYIARGIVIPTMYQGNIWRIQIRRAPGTEPKYLSVTGSRGALYGADSIKKGRSVVLVEGVFDALAIQQSAGDIVCAVAVGTTSTTDSRWRAKLSLAHPLIIGIDNDIAGNEAGDKWMQVFPNAKRLQPDGGKDANEMLVAGVDIRAWVLDALAPVPVEITEETSAQPQDNLPQPVTLPDRSVPTYHIETRETWIMLGLRQYCAVLSDGTPLGWRDTLAAAQDSYEVWCKRHNITGKTT